MTANSALRRFSIGRSPACDVVLADDSVSRRHAELSVLEDGLLFVVDCRSTHGTKVQQDGAIRDVRQEVIAPTAILHFGDVAIPASDVLAELMAKHPGLHPSTPNPGGGGSGLAGPSRLARGGAASPPAAWARGTRLVRCSCGVIKAKDQERCAECGA